MNHDAKYSHSSHFDIYTNRNDKWIGLFTKSRTGQDNNCPTITTEYYICIIPCVVFAFSKTRFTGHKTKCWHKDAKKNNSWWKLK